MGPGKQACTHPQGRLQGSRMAAESIAERDGFRHSGKPGRIPRRQFSGQRGDPPPDIGIHVAAGYRETVPPRVVPAVKPDQVVPSERIVPFGRRRYPVRMLRPEQRPGKELPCLESHLRPLHSKTLFLFGTICPHFVLRELRSQQDLLCDLHRLREETRKRTESHHGIIPVGAHFVIGAVKVEPFGDLCRRRPARSLAEQIHRRRSGEGHLLQRGSSPEHEADADHLLSGNIDHIEPHAVVQHVFANRRHLGPAGRHDRRRHRTSGPRRILFSFHSVSVFASAGTPSPDAR